MWYTFFSESGSESTYLRVVNTLLCAPGDSDRGPGLDRGQGVDRQGRQQGRGQEQAHQVIEGKGESDEESKRKRGIEGKDESRYRR